MPTPFKITPAVHPQLLKLEALRAACDRALLVASKGELFASAEGIKLTNAAYDLFEVDGLYDLAGDVAFELHVDRETLRPTPLGEAA